jgi:hypothetical protein
LKNVWKSLENLERIWREKLLDLGEWKCHYDFCYD